MPKAQKIKREKRNIRRTIALVLIFLLSIITLIKYFGGTNMEEIVVFETNMGNFEIELNRQKAPLSVDNFLSYVKEGYYDGLIFHRVIPDFMIQGGGFDSNMTQKKTKAQIKNEAGNGLKNDKYTVAMARTFVVDSATSQFFINVENNDFLNHVNESQRGYGYAVFGKVISGFDTVEKIKLVKTRTVGSFENVPVEPVVINKAYIK